MTRRWLEPAAQWTMILGVVFLCQPWVALLHRYGLTVTIAGLVGFLVATHLSLPEEAAVEEEEELV
jgi:hypothetical protein